ncbi:arsenical pump membrane protein [Motilibacter peucedani]|uniref:Arsenical pump membrane protein n=1 Tax=Motilibacter peucedani TaxID=598650 RepID=A0A420XP45_9ACTN|nr:SLC13 family permease [Motilibacter peucedani]RKS73973.1 arsenical pump membrane protein [Motilibacter peucedani]
MPDGPRTVRFRLVPIAAALAGLLAVLTGALSRHGASEVAHRTLPVLGFLVAITVVAELSDEAGLFDVAARRAALLGRGRTRTLFLLVCVLATATTTVLSLDTTAVLLTPVVLALASALELDPLPFAFATVWLANTASLLLPVSNLTNLLAETKTGLGAVEFASHSWPAQLALLVVTLAVLLLRHRRTLRGRYSTPPEVAVEDRVLLRLSAVVTLAVGPLLVAGLAPWVVATAAAVVLVAGFAARRPASVRPRRLAGLLPWQLVLMTLGLFLVVQTLLEHGLDGTISDLAGAGGSSTGGLLRLGGVAAVASNLVNNLPAFLAVEPVAHGTTQVLALLVGVNAGPLVLVWGSLATLLWRERCASRGVRVGAFAFAREGLLVAPLAVVSGCLALAWR